MVSDVIHNMDNPKLDPADRGGGQPMLDNKMGRDSLPWKTESEGHS